MPTTSSTTVTAAGVTGRCHAAVAGRRHADDAGVPRESCGHCGTARHPSVCRRTRLGKVWRMPPSVIIGVSTPRLRSGFHGENGVVDLLAVGQRAVGQRVLLDDLCDGVFDAQPVFERAVDGEHGQILDG